MFYFYDTYEIMLFNYILNNFSKKNYILNNQLNLELLFPIRHRNIFSFMKFIRHLNITFKLFNGQYITMYLKPNQYINLCRSQNKAYKSKKIKFFFASKLLGHHIHFGYLQKQHAHLLCLGKHALNKIYKISNMWTLTYEPFKIVCLYRSLTYPRNITSSYFFLVNKHRMEYNFVCHFVCEKYLTYCHFFFW